MQQLLKCCESANVFIQGKPIPAEEKRCEGATHLFETKFKTAKNSPFKSWHGTCNI